MWGKQRTTDVGKGDGERRTPVTEPGRGNGVRGAHPDKSDMSGGAPPAVLKARTA